MLASASPGAVVWADAPKPPYYVLGLDPGCVNLGVVLLDVITMQIEYKANIYIANLDTVQGNDAYFSHLLSSYFDKQFPFPIHFVAIEQNCHRRWQIVCESAMLGYWCARGSITTQVHPTTIKSFFQYLGCRGHENNKEDAIFQAKELGYEDLSNHEADALLVGLWCVWKKAVPMLIQEGCL